MSITAKISTAIAGITFALFALGAAISAENAQPASTSVVADHGWGEPQPPAPKSTFAISDDHGWG